MAMTGERSSQFPRLPAADPQSLRWDRRTWTPWLPFQALTASATVVRFGWLSSDWADGPGVYRIRAVGREGLQYIGQAARVLPRLRVHLAAANRTLVGKSKAKTPRRTSGFEWRLATQLNRGARIEVSWTHATEDELLALEDRLIKEHAKVVGREPIWQNLPQTLVPSFGTKEERSQGGTQAIPAPD